METIRIEDVSGNITGSWYDEYRRLRHRIFVGEQGWMGLSGPTEQATVPDPTDVRARFWLARGQCGALVGAVRIRPVCDVFPHEDLFHQHLARREVTALRPWMGTLNSLMVDREWRGRRCAGSNGDTGSIASMLLRTSLGASAASGLRALVATAQTAISARALMRAGFRVIDPPVRTCLHPSFRMCNVGIVLRPDDPCAYALSKYFDDRQRELLSPSGRLPFDF
ncbi:MAG TPA: hypothetical protein VMS40_23495 [Vicinamibacterales bacterium]|nr:hypothetical protein [Vicinamibacterales bacterium]